MTPESNVLCACIIELADDVLAQPLHVQTGECAEWGLSRQWGANALLGAIDCRCPVGGCTGHMFPSSLPPTVLSNCVT